MKNEIRRKTLRGRLHWLALCSLLFLILPHPGGLVQAKAADTIRNETQGSVYSTARNAFKNAKEGDVLSLLRDTSVGETLQINKKMTIDLNGHLLDLRGHNFWNAAELSVINSHEESGEEDVHYFLRSAEGWWTLLTGPTEAQKNSAVDVAGDATSMAGADVVKITGSVLYNGRGTVTSDTSNVTCGGAIINTIFYPGTENELTGSLKAENISFLGCSADVGGAILNEGGKVELENVSAYCCSARSGAFAYNVEGKQLQIDRAKVKFCSATENGGAILNFGNAALSEVSICSCSANNQGGAILNGLFIDKTRDFSDASMSLSDSSIALCSVKNQGHGGAVSNYGTLSMEGTDIASCVAMAGGGIFNYNTLTMKDGSIKDSNGSKYAGAIFSDGVLTHQDAQDRAKATDTVTTLENVNIENCDALDHISEGQQWHEAIYIRNSTFVMKSGYVENQIFMNDHSAHDIFEGGLNIGEQDGFPPCSVTIAAGKFKNFKPSLQQLAKGSSLVVYDGFSYVVDQAFKAEPAPEKSETAPGQKQKVTWNFGGAVDSFLIEQVDEKTGEWKKVATVENGAGFYEFAQPDGAPATIKCRVVAIKGGAPAGVSKEFTLTWKKQESQGSDDAKKPAAKGTKLDVTTAGGIYTVTSAPGEEPEVSFRLGKKGEKKVTIPETVECGGITYRVTSIDKNAFKNNKAVVNIVIPASVTKFGANLFAGMPKLKSIKFLSKTLKDGYFNKKTFKGVKPKCVIKVNKKKVKAYGKMFRKKGLAKKVKVKKG